MFRLSRFLLLACAAGYMACAAPVLAADTLMMATTTSTQDSGLLEYLEPVFKQETGIELKWVAVGTGKALEIAKNCDADVLWCMRLRLSLNSSRPGMAWTAVRSCTMTL